MKEASIPASSPPDTACKVCGSPARYLFSQSNEHGEVRTLHLFLCAFCGLLFVGNALSAGELAAAYETLDSNRYYQQVGVPTDRKIARALDDLEPLLRAAGERASVLEVGCGDGRFLAALRHLHPSVRAVGQELPGAAATACQEKGFPVFTSALENLAENFSIILLLDVAEHVPHPNRTFAACRSLLNKNGYLYLHTPRRCFWDDLFLNLTKVSDLRRWTRAWLRTRVSIFHLHLWTDKALRLSLEKAGFQLVYLKPLMELSWPLERYTRVYLKEKLGLPSLFVRLATVAADLLFVRLGTLRNKAICLARAPASDAA